MDEDDPLTMLDDLVAAYTETEQLCDAFLAGDVAAVKAHLIDIGHSPVLGAAMLGWASTLAAAGTGQEAVDLIPEPVPEGTGHLTRLVDVAAGGRVAARAGLKEQLTDRSDAELWQLCGDLAEAVCRWTASIGGLAHWLRLLAAHEEEVVVDADRDTLAGRTAAVIGLVSAGHLRQAHDRLGRIISGGHRNLTGVLQMWLQLTAIWLDDKRAIMITDWSGVPTAMVDPHGGDPTGDDIDRLHLLELVDALLDANRAGDVAGVQAATGLITALDAEQRMVLAWLLATSLGMHAARWQQPADPSSPSA